MAASLEGRVHTVMLNVRNRTEVEACIKSLPQEWQAIDVLVNNAGLSRGLDPAARGAATIGWDEMIDTNIKGLLWVSRAVIPGMVARGRGHVINVGSIAGHEVYPGGNVYCATKFAVDALTKGMRMDLKVDTRSGSRAVDPGMVETEFSEVRFYGDRERAKNVYKGIEPLTGDDVADAIVWASTRPANVQIAQITILPQAQASAMVNFRKG